MIKGVVFIVILRFLAFIRVYIEVLYIDYITGFVYVIVYIFVSPLHIVGKVNKSFRLLHLLWPWLVKVQFIEHNFRIYLILKLVLVG